MGYQALLFCPDEKLARVVSQVFGELEFAVEGVSEPFVTVKKMMAQRYDAVVVDCTDEQNATLLLKSARNSSFNQGSLAIALVEGQAGVAKAYRIGANLVLTKPINVEQAKGTLRVARGLLRKSFDAANAASHAAPTADQTGFAEPATAAPAGAGPASRTVGPVTAAASHTVTPAVEAPLATIAASAQNEEKTAAVPVPAAETGKPIVAQAPAESAPSTAKLASQEQAKADALKPPAAATPAPNIASMSQGAAAAPAPAKEVTGPASKEVKDKDLKKTAEADTQKQKAAGVAPAIPPQAGLTGTSRVSEGPAFAALGIENAGASARSKKFFLVAVGVLALAAAGYFAWTKFSGAHLSKIEQLVTPSLQQKTATAPAPVAIPAPSPSESVINRASGSGAATVSKPAPAQAGQSPESASSVPRVAANPEPEPKKTAPTPILVKAATARSKSEVPAEEPVSQPPSPLAVSPAGDNGISGLVAAPASGAQPVLARIKVSQGVSQGLLIKRVQPKYPPNALTARAEGEVQIEATISKEGTVVNPKVLSGHPALAAAALAAVRQWRYKPYYLNGEPVEIQTQITINFKLD